MEIPKEAESFSMIILMIGETSQHFKTVVVLTTLSRPESKFAGLNHIHFRSNFLNWVSLPIIPPK